MSSKTKIVVLRMKEIIYTAIFIGFGILLVMLLFIMFHPKKENSSDSASPASYIPGVYSSSLTLGSQEINVEVTVDKEQICSVSMVPLSDSVETMFPLVQPSLEHLTGMPSCSAPASLQTKRVPAAEIRFVLAVLYWYICESPLYVL